MQQKSLTRFIWLSIAAAIVTIILKFTAFYITSSIGLLSDALESFVNLAAAIMALFITKLAEKPPDKEHIYGHTKAEYFSSIVEGTLILLAAVSIGFAAINRVLYPQSIEQAPIGIALSIVASLINLVIAFILLRASKKYNSIILEADGHHLMTDVWTSVGVIGGIFLVSFTHIQMIDPIIAILVALNIVSTGISIMKKSTLGLMDTSLNDEDISKIERVLNKYCSKNIEFHGLRTRQSATRKFMSVHILVPGAWSVQKGHDLLEKIELEICRIFPKITVTTHLEPIEDPKAMEDISIDRSY